MTESKGADVKCGCDDFPVKSISEGPWDEYEPDVYALRGLSQLELARCPLGLPADEGIEPR